MKRVFVILTVLTIVFSMFCAFALAQESDERREKDEPRRSEETRRAERRVPVERRMEQRRVRERPEQLGERLLVELERQREEINALREEIAALRRMLENRYASRRPRQARRQFIRQEERKPERRPSRERREPERRDAPREIDIAIREFEGRVERHPDDLEARMRLAHFYLEVDKIEAAIHQYRAIQDIDPAFDPPYEALEELRHKFPRLFQEREESREPERRDEQRSHFERELRELEEKVEQHPDDIELRMRLAHFYLEVDKKEAAIMQYKAALKIKPDFDPPYKALKELGYKFPDEPRDREEPKEEQ